MAIDTAAKRLSVLNYTGTRIPPLPTGLVELSDRYHLLGTYIGLVAGTPLVLVMFAFAKAFRTGLSQSYNIQQEL